MTILYIDPEHEQVIEHPTLGPDHRARLEAARTRVAAAAEAPCVVAGFREMNPARVAALAPAAIVIGGCATDWAHYDFTAMTGLLDIIRAAPAPILGICAGHQLIGFAHRAPWGPLGVLAEGEVDPNPDFAPGQRKEHGFLPVRLDLDCPIFRDMDPNAAFFQSHYWQLQDVPAGFTTRATSPWSSIQAIERWDRPVFGVQFHPERYDAARPCGAIVLRNFFALARSALPARGAVDRVNLGKWSTPATEYENAVDRRVLSGHDG